MANLLTAVRLVLLFPVAWSFANPIALAPAALLSMVIVAIITDYFDGKVARARGTASGRGMLFDHATDFLFVSSSLAALSLVGLVHPLLPILIAIAFSQYVLDSYFLFKQKHLRMSFLGRWNGIFYFAPLLVFSISRLEFLAALQQNLQTAGSWLAYLLIISTIASIIDRFLAPLKNSTK